MPASEGIRSPIPMQVSARSTKLRIYESLFQFNQSIDHVIGLLRKMGSFRFADREELRSFIVEIEAVRCDLNADFVEHLVDSERFDEGRFAKERHDYEKQWRDPDDVYIEVERREEERKKQGLPPRLGIVPHSVVAKEEERWELEQERMKHRPKKRRKAPVQAKHKGQEKNRG